VDTKTDSSKPYAIERWIEETLPDYRFGLVLLLLLFTFVFMASGLETEWSPAVSVTLQGLTLLAALRASQVSRRTFRLAVLVVVVAFVAAIASLFISNTDSLLGATFTLNAFLVAAPPVAIGRALWRRQVVDIHTVLGAICIYVLVGMLFAFIYSAIGYFGDEAFFTETSHASTSIYLYFSFITLTTVGYGDFTPANGLGRSLASIEALLGQLYLVTVVATVVSRMVRAPSRGGDADAEAAEPTAQA
jgi:hypothetical protein